MKEAAKKSPASIKKEVVCKTEPTEASMSDTSQKSSHDDSGDEEYDQDCNMEAQQEEELSNNSQMFTRQKVNLPRMNVPEKIIICIDLCADNESGTPFRFGDGTKQNTLAMLKRVVQMFLYCKMTTNIKHQYALMLLHEDGASWQVDFTQNPVEITNILATLKSRDQPPEFNLGSMFDVIADKVIVPLVTDPNNELPSHVVRVVQLYARTNCRPVLPPGHGSAKALMDSPFFFIDIVYVHEPLSEETKFTCQSIFNDLCSELSLPSSYVFNVGRNPTKLHDCIAKLLAHPLQRPKQQDAEYKLLMPE